MTDANYLVLLYYYFTDFLNPVQIWKEQQQFCKQYNFKGRIIISKEGLNGTISGPVEDCKKYMQYVTNTMKLPVEFKQNNCPKHLFPKLSIKLKDEIIKIGANVNTQKQTGIHLNPRQFQELIQQDDVLLLDLRSNCEHQVGKFKNAITFDMTHMYQFPKILENHNFLNKQDNKEKKIITYCTGGIKCEKASSFLMSKGFSKVYQLQGGIIKYGNETDGKDFQGKCYVFDDRVTTSINQVNPCVISQCYICKSSCDIMVNCMNTKCNLHTVICNTCYQKYEHCCSSQCAQSKCKRNIYSDYHSIQST